MQAWLCSACACSGTISFSVLCCTLGSSLHPFLKHSCTQSRRLPNTLPRLSGTCFQIIWTLTPCPGRKLLERHLWADFTASNGLGKNRRWMGRRETPHVTIYFKICKWLAILSFYHILYQQLYLNYRTSSILFYDIQSPHLHLG